MEEGVGGWWGRSSMTCRGIFQRLEITGRWYGYGVDSYSDQEPLKSDIEELTKREESRFHGQDTCMKEQIDV